MTYWIVVGSPDNFQTAIDRWFDLFGFKSTRRKASSEMEPGDKLVFYLTGIKMFGGIATLFVFVLFAWQFFRFTLFDVTLTGLATVVLEVPQAPWWWAVTVIICLCVPIQLAIILRSLYDAVRGHDILVGSREVEINREALGSPVGASAAPVAGQFGSGPEIAAVGRALFLRGCGCTDA